MTEAFSQQLEVEIDGGPLDPAAEALLEAVVTDDSTHVPDMVVLTFRDVERTVLETARIRIGSTIRIRATPIGGSEPMSIFDGEVTSLEGEYTEAGTLAIVRGYDPSHRLFRGGHTTTYLGMKDSDIAGDVARRAGLRVGTIDDSGPVHDHVSQHNQTDMAFLRGRAAEIGFEVGVRDGTFEFRRPQRSTEGPAEGDFESDDPLQLVFGRDLLEFRPRVTSSGQVSRVQVRGWDPGAKEGVVGEADATTTSTDVRDTPADLAAVFGNPVLVATERPLRTQAAVDAAAQALAEVVGGVAVEAEGIARGNPRIKPDAAVSVSVVGEPFAGRYLVTAATHRFDRQGYRTRFVVSGRTERSLLGLTGGNGHDGHLGRVEGVVCALVTNNDDPDRLGRVKLKFPWLSDDYESDWSRLATPGAGPDSGVTFLPQVNDEVLVAFEQGEIQRPYVLGGLWNGVDKPRLGDGLVDNGAINRRGIVSRRGHRFVLFDGQGDSGIALLTSDDRLSIALHETGTEIHVRSDGTILIEGTRDITVKSSANVSVEASGTLTLKGQGGVTITSSGVVDIDGSVIQLN